MNTNTSFTSEDIILVTGATGFTGVNLMQKLCATGAQVRAIARASSVRDSLKHLPIQWIVGDVYDEETIKKAITDVNYIFHVAAAFREAKVSDQVYTDVHVNSTKLLAKYALKQPNFKRFLHTSTMGVHGHIETPPADENYPFAPGDEYQRTKVEGELWIREFARDEGLPLTVIRPCGIYGPGDKRLLKVFKMAKLPICPLLGFGCKGLYHLIHVEDLTSFMIEAALNEKTLGEVYLCGNSSAISTKDMIKIIGSRLGKTPIFLRLPVTPFFILGDICEFICKPLGIEPPIYRRRVAFFTKDRSFNTEKMRKDTGYKYQYDNRKGIEELVDWYRQNKWL